MNKKANNDMPSAGVAPNGKTKPTVNPLLENKEMDKNKTIPDYRIGVKNEEEKIKKLINFVI